MSLNRDSAVFHFNTGYILWNCIFMFWNFWNYIFRNLTITLHCWQKYSRCSTANIMDSSSSLVCLVKIILEPSMLLMLWTILDWEVTTCIRDLTMYLLDGNTCTHFDKIIFLFGSKYHRNNRCYRWYIAFLCRSLWISMLWFLSHHKSMTR